jgi:hypothetical protein
MFYRTKRTKDGLQYRCKSCEYKAYRKRYEANPDRVKVVKQRYRDKDRAKVRKIASDSGKREHCRKGKTEYQREWRKTYPAKYKAHQAVSSAIKKGILLKPTTCDSCASEQRIVAHHADYLKPLEVEWLCDSCHNKWHLENGEGLNAKENTTQ